MLFEVFHQLGHFYQAYRVMQDSGIWMTDMEALAHYWFSRIIDAK